VLLADIPEDERLSSMHIVDERGRVFSAGDAVIKLLWVNPKTRRRARAARWVPWLRRKVAREYQRLADRRAELSERVDDVPPTTVRPRWINLPS
jgi:predicted DCC family thiol-disulfide oxidoreductase YuxK